MRKQAINSSSLRIAVRKNYSLLLVKISLFAFASVTIAAKHLAVVDVGSAIFVPWRDVAGFAWWWTGVLTTPNMRRFRFGPNWKILAITATILTKHSII